MFHDLQDSYWHEKASQKYQARKLLIGQKKNEKYFSDKLVQNFKVLQTGHSRTIALFAMPFSSLEHKLCTHST